MLDLTAELDKLTALPEGADSATLEPHWCRLLDLFDTHPGQGVAFAECLHELALRHMSRCLTHSTPKPRL